MSPKYHRECYSSDKAIVFQYKPYYSSESKQGDVSTAILPIPNGSWSFFAIVDGYGGRETSRWLSEHLIIALAGSLADLYAQFDPSDPISSRGMPSNAIEDTLKSTFLRLDHDIVNERVEEVLRWKPPRGVGVKHLAPSLSGAHALLVFYEEQTRLLRSGLTGTPRAVLGRQVIDDKPYTVHVLASHNDGGTVMYSFLLTFELNH
jgi:pyruvate dehydrogenase phosphatase